MAAGVPTVRLTGSGRRSSVTVEFRGRHLPFAEGEFLIVPRGVQHRPVADEGVHVLLFRASDAPEHGQRAGRADGRNRPTAFELAETPSIQ